MTPRTLKGSHEPTLKCGTRRKVGVNKLTRYLRAMCPGGLADLLDAIAKLCRQHTTKSSSSASPAVVALPHDAATIRSVGPLQSLRLLQPALQPVEIAGETVRLLGVKRRLLDELTANRSSEGANHENARMLAHLGRDGLVCRACPGP